MSSMHQLRSLIHHGPFFQQHKKRWPIQAQRVVNMRKQKKMVSFSVQYYILLFKVAPYNFSTVRERTVTDFENCAMARDHAVKCTEKARPNFVYRKSCMVRLRFQNIYRLNRRPYLSPLYLNEEMYQVCESFNQIN